MATAPVNQAITLADVRAALTDTDPTKTNASALRAILGRGSFATIQKHLDTIRAERLPALAPNPGAAPAAPEEAVAAIWGAAWSAAQAHTLARLELITAQRDQLSCQVEQLGQDLAAALASVDAEQAAAQQAATAMQEAKQAAQEAKEAAKHAQEALDHAKTAWTAQQAASAAALALADKDSKLQTAALQSTIDRLTDQIGELKSLLPRQHP